MSASDNTCEVCGGHGIAGVAAIPMVPISAAYCITCLQANAHPWQVLVAGTAVMGGLQAANVSWKEMVYATCERLKRTVDSFEIEVGKSMAELEDL